MAEHPGGMQPGRDVISSLDLLNFNSIKPSGPVDTA